MLGRRRNRLLAAIVFFALVFTLYSKRPQVSQIATSDRIVGGGAVIRPHGKEGTSSAARAAPTRHPATPTLEEDKLPIAFGQGRKEPDSVAAELTRIHWTSAKEQFPISTTMQLPTATAAAIPRIQIIGPKAGKADKQRLDKIREATQWAWNGYRNKGWGADEIKPVSGGVKNLFNGWGATLVDSLDTLWIMDMKKEFDEAVEQVKNIDFTTTKRSDIPLFETTIRYLGGLIGAYDVTGRQQQYAVLLHKAVELADVLYSAFDTPNRMPQTYYRWRPAFASQPHRAGYRVILAELGSLSLEFTRLAQLTGEPKYYDAVQRITDALEEWQNNTRIPGMWPINVDASGCEKPAQIHVKPASVIQYNDNGDQMMIGPPLLAHGPKKQQKRDNLPSAEPQSSPNTRSESQYSGQDVCLPKGLGSASKSGDETFSLGAMSDSTYEYLPKEYLLLGGKMDQYKKMYERAADVAKKYVLFRPMTPDNVDILFSGVLYVGVNITDDSYIYQHVPEAEHLSCFAGGMFAMGGKIFNRPEEVEIGAKLTNGCVWAYNVSQTGIMPEKFLTVRCSDSKDCPWDEKKYWAALDPYEESRQQLSNLPQQKPPPHHYSDESPSEKNLESRMRNSTIGPRAAADETDRFLPAEPLSHEDFVAARIAEERLPPGFTSVESRKYILRPEAIESVFYMFRITGNEYWREVGWNMFVAIDTHTRTSLAHSAVKDVTMKTTAFEDSMESFWIAETLKYFYLLFEDSEKWSLDDYVFNTEAHPFKRM